MYHEILHLDLGADSVNGNPNPQTHDLTIDIRVNKFGYYKTEAYGPERAKVLARYTPVLANDFETGYYTQRDDRSK
jgi:hypothetical protein